MKAKIAITAPETPTAKDMNAIAPNIVTTIFLPSNEAAEVQISAGNVLQFRIPGAWAFEDWDKCKVESNTPLLQVERVGVGMVNVKSAKPEVECRGTVSFSGNVDTFDGQGYRLLSGSVVLVFTPPTVASCLVGSATNASAVAVRQAG